MMNATDKIKDDIFNLVNKYADIKYQEKIFEPNKSFIPVSGKVIDKHEIKFIVESLLVLKLSDKHMKFKTLPPFEYILFSYIFVPA